MTVNELLLDLQCYQMYFNPGCDIHNLSIKELAEFITMRDEINKIDDIIQFKEAPILEVFEDIITNEMRDKYSKEE
ncbi:MAG: hypothetical protein B6226_06215 [Candidatus Cloacimonetes bacterium 4572_65]|nr:MAG: hypothetical protein B6226_06215 [Candidatus Cloacimonetes bacterium 4572_65]